ncbi:hypothetical protein FDZ71_14660, partial [bacterium]
MDEEPSGLVINAKGFPTGARSVRMTRRAAGVRTDGWRDGPTGLSFLRPALEAGRPQGVDGNPIMGESRDSIPCQRVAVISVLVILIFTPLCVGQDERRISCFLIGSVMAGICPLPNFFTEDPMFTWEQDPHQAGLDLKERTRLDRLYFPRSRKMLLEKFDMIFFADPYIDHF